ITAEAASSPAALRPALDHARAGRFDALMADLAGAKPDQLAPTFLRGLALYSRGDLEAAAGQFRQALRLSSDFFPAAFYLGACYAAGGRDREAAGAWQTSLVTETDAPFVYTLLGDALLRLNEAEQATDILAEASSLWPGNEQVRLKLATAYAMGGRGADSLEMLDRHLAAHPADHERLFLAMRVLYEARAAGGSIASPAEDLQRFTTYAAAYDAANGPQQALVDQWRQFFDKGKS
ncbi:MAG: hypothetical protein LC804_13730, partial [Acidobacteria bacterium]|nr:hypothetical protein [Acidobacteriota bacterium]